MSDLELVALATLTNVVFLWLEVWSLKKTQKKELEKLKERLILLEHGSSEEARYMSGTWLS